MLTTMRWFPVMDGKYQDEKEEVFIEIKDGHLLVGSGDKIDYDITFEGMQVALCGLIEVEVE